MKYSCLIVDDEQLARLLMQDYVSKVPHLELRGLCKNPLEAMAVLQSETIDIMFLDIQMPELTGVEFLRTLKTKPAIIFTTAYSEYALEGYQLDVTDYLVKPFPFERFAKAVNKAIEVIDLKNAAKTHDLNKGKASETILLHADHKIYKIRLDDINYIEGLKEYVSYFTRDKRIIVLQSLKTIEETLPSDRFIRVHRSYIVPIDKIKTLDGNQVQIGDKFIPIGRSYKDEVMRRVFSSFHDH
ncbi:MAG: response regulator transcription factor [Cyclobacteriaceae bacterium]|nr:response regulator transcription factor [Cyclobacteriaceae bacterium]